MRIKKIEFFNINSLKGHHCIDFDQGILSTAGLFAITGPTGSGKSTILDVITLALYNQVPRFGKISRSNIEKLGAIVTHLCTEAYAEVSYTAQGKSYRSRWSISSKKAGGFRDYDMDLVDLETELSLGIKKSELPKKNEELIGLSYEQFVKSIVLSQGDFAVFLKAKKEDRTKLLEEITGSYIYRELGVLAFEQTKEKQESVQRLKEQIELIELPTTETIEAIQQRDKALQTECIQDKKEIQVLQHCIQIKSMQDKTAKLAEEIKALEKTLLENKTAFKADQIRLEQHEQLEPYEATILDFQKLSQEKLSIEKDTKQNAEELKLAQTKLQEAIELLSRLIQPTEAIDVSNFYSQMNAFETKIGGLDKELHHLTNRGKQIRKRINESLEKIESPIKNELIATKQPEAFKTLLIDRLQNIQIDSSLRLEDLSALWSQKQHQITVLRSYIELQAKIVQAKQAQVEIEQTLKLQQEEKKNRQASVHTAQQAEQTATLTLKALEKEQKEAVKTMDYETARQHLVENEPCPLCGSTEHPYATHQDLVDLGLLSLKIEQHTQQLKQKQQEVQQKTIEAQRTELQIEQSVKLLEQQGKTQQALIADKQDVEQNNAWIRTISDGAWEQKCLELKKEITALEQQNKQREEHKALVDLQGETEELIQCLQSYHTTQQARHALYQGDDVSNETNDIQNLFAAQSNAIELHTKQATKLQEKEEKRKHAFEDCTKTLNAVIVQFKIDSIEQCMNRLLDHQSLKIIRAKQRDIHTLQTRISERNNLLQSGREELEKAMVDLDEANVLRLEVSEVELRTDQQAVQSLLDKKLQVQGQIRAQLAQYDKQKQQIHELQQKLDQQIKSNHYWLLLNDMIGDARGKKFSNFAQDLSLMHLLQQANARLSKLTDRYELSFKIDADDLQIIDHYQGGMMRAVKTLSGGESFIISLALALSLSDFASNNINIESLFIDEGFGTLDLETLETAMETLEKLQDQSGKRIGVISHVQSLKERIHTQIQLEKSTQGYSTITIVA